MMLLTFLLCLGQSLDTAEPLELDGVTITPHLRAESMRYRRESDPDLAARVQIFLRNAAPAGSPTLRFGESSSILFDGEKPGELLASGEWAWHDVPGFLPGWDVDLSPGALTVWTLNGRSSRWGPGRSFDLRAAPETGGLALETAVPIAAPDAWLSAVTSLASGGDFRPDVLVVHLANETGGNLRIASCRLWLPAEGKSFRAFLPQPPLEDIALFPADGVIPARDKGALRARSGRAPGSCPSPSPSWRSPSLGQMGREGPSGPTSGSSASPST